MKSYMYLLIH